MLLFLFITAQRVGFWNRLVCLAKVLGWESWQASSWTFVKSVTETKALHAELIAWSPKESLLKWSLRCWSEYASVDWIVTFSLSHTTSRWCFNFFANASCKYVFLLATALPFYVLIRSKWFSSEKVFTVALNTVLMILLLVNGTVLAPSKA